MHFTPRQAQTLITRYGDSYSGRKLKIQGKDLIFLHKSLFSLIHLEVLELTPERESCLELKLSEVPRDIGRLVNLKVLCLDTNELLEVPVEMCLLKRLERLSLSNNNLTSLPTGFGDLQNLTSLHMANNDFTEFPSCVCKLETLQFLDFSDNHLMSLPEEIGNLKQLVTLLLFYNDLTSLPESICTLTELTCLWVGNNRIKELPSRFGDLKKLDWNVSYTSAALEGNPLVHPPLEICRMGPVAIGKYLSNEATGPPSQRSRHADRQTNMRTKTEV